MINFIAGIFGKIMNFIFECFYSIGIKDVGLNIDKNIESKTMVAYGK